MLLWAGIILLVSGVVSFAFDRRAAHYFHDVINQRWNLRIHKTTDWAKGGHWLAVSVLVLLASWIARRFFHGGVVFVQLEQIALAFLVALAIGSAILHAMKLFLGRRRPRDELELDLYGFMPWRFDFQYDSFPSGHALTITCVAVVASGAWPALAILWFAIALYLAFTRAALTAHFLSDVFIGAGIGMIVTRETILFWFPHLMQAWF
jgi:membrane-associated phospholipid phosphatase